MISKEQSLVWLKIFGAAAVAVGVSAGAVAEDLAPLAYVLPFLAAPAKMIAAAGLLAHSIGTAALSIFDRLKKNAPI